MRPPLTLPPRTHRPSKPTISMSIDARSSWPAAPLHGPALEMSKLIQISPIDGAGALARSPLDLYATWSLALCNALGQAERSAQCAARIGPVLGEIAHRTALGNQPLAGAVDLRTIPQAGARSALSSSERTGFSSSRGGRSWKAPQFL
jgi:hypothetical protein